MASKRQGPIKIGIIGLGRAGWGMHCGELKSRGDKFQIVAACDVIPERLKAMKDKYGCKTYAKAEDLVKDPEVELVSVASLSPDHVAHAALALKAGKTVFQEKPIAVSKEQCKTLKQLAAKYPGKLFLRHNRRFENPFVKIRELIAKGQIGEVYEVKLRRHGYGRRDDWQTLKSFDGGQLNNWGPHIIDHSLQFLGSPIAEIWSDLKLVAAVGDAEDHLKIVFKGENGRIVDMEISGGAALSEPEYLIFGTKGAIQCSGNEIKVKRLDPKAKLPPRKASAATPPNEGSFGTPDKLVWIEEAIKVDADGTPGNSGTHSIWDHLYAAVRNGKKFPVTLEEGFAIIDVILKVKAGTKFEKKPAKKKASRKA